VTTTSEVRRELRPTLALALPIIVGQVSQMLIGLTDTAFIGRLGAVPLAAAAFTQGISGMCYVVCVGMLVGPGVFAARDHGAGDEVSCASWLRHGRALALVTALAACSLLALVSTQFERLGQPREVVAIVRPFFLLISASLVPALVFQVQRQFAESVGQAWGPMCIIVVDVALNALFNWVLVFGHFGFAPLGLLGSGYATLLARLCAVLAIALWLRLSSHFSGLRTAAWSGFRMGRFMALLRLGLPAGVMLLFETGAFSASALMMGWLGAVSLAAHQVALSCAALTFMVPLGLSHAVSLRISRARGEGRALALRAIGVGGLLTGLLLMSTFALLFTLAGSIITETFTPARDVSKLATQLLVVAAIFQVFDGVQVISVGALRGLTDVRLPAGLTFAAYWLLSLPLGYWLAFHTELGPRGLWIGLAAGLAAAAVSLAWRFLHKTRLPNAA
jgi:MATE family multidrug resistance protein